MARPRVLDFGVRTGEMVYLCQRNRNAGGPETPPGVRHQEVAPMTAPQYTPVRRIPLPHGFHTLIDDTDWPRVATLTLYRGANGYVYFSEWRDGRSQPQTLHGFLMDAPKGTHVDHRNGDKLDNRRENLRVTTPVLNQVNRHRLNKNNTSGVRGVAFVAQWGKWRAQITAHRRTIHLGLFLTQEEAITARKAAELRYRGEACPDQGF